MSRLSIFESFPSPPEKCDRTVRIWLPKAYGTHRRQRFPVLYMHDGQNLFDQPGSALEETWAADAIMDELVDRGMVPPSIIVAVDHRGPLRMADMGPWPNPPVESRANAAKYARFLVEHLKPHIDSELRTLPEPDSTAVMGSSLGGLMSLYLGLKHPGVFGRIGALSPSVMWGDGAIFHAWKSHGRKPLRIYMDVGGREHIPGMGRKTYASWAKDFHKHLVGLGYSEDELAMVVEPEGHHHEIDWRRRLPFALTWLLAPRSCRPG